VWLQVESGVVGADGFARTASPPFPGVVDAGLYALAYGPSAQLTLQLPSISPGIDFLLSITGVAALFGPNGATVNLPYGRHLLSILRVPEVGLPTRTALEVEVNPDKINTFAATLPIPPLPLPDSFAPEIDSVELALTQLGPEVILTGRRFTYAVPNAPTSRGGNIADLSITFRSSDGTEVIAQPNLLTSTSTKLHVLVPRTVVLGLATISVTRPGYARTISPGSSVLQFRSRDLVSNRASLALAARQNQYVFVANAVSQDVGVINGDPRSPGFNQVIATIPTAPTPNACKVGYQVRLEVMYVVTFT
jgi:hypothetical protein